MTLDINFKKFGLVLLLLVLVTAAGYLAVSTGVFARASALLWGTPTFTQTSDPQTAPDAQAAADAVMAFYTLDYTEPAEQWTERMCALSSDAGCQAVQNFFTAAVRKTVEDHQVQTGATAVPLYLVEVLEDGRHIWLVQVTLSNPWEGLESATQEVHVEMVQDDATQRWLLNRVLFEQEALGRYDATPTP